MTEQTSPAAAAVDITLLVCTYNRCDDLRELLETALTQETGGEFTYEVLVVDNNSIDQTRSVVEGFIAQGHTNLHYLFESRQGKSHALNTGIGAVSGWAYTIADDDFILPKDWVRGIFEGFRDHPDAAFVSGKVLPLWQAKAPAWLTQKHWSAIAMADYGEQEFYTDQLNQICLLACSFRRADVQAVGGYHAELGPMKGRTGATEDLDLLQRLWKAGRKGVYLPKVAFYHKVTADRLTTSYHRRWHTDHGRSYAVMRDEQVEQATARLFDVPVHLYRQAAIDALAWLKLSFAGKRDEAFLRETHLRFFTGFFRQRRADFLASGTHSFTRELWSLAKAFKDGKAQRHAPKEIG